MRKHRIKILVCLVLLSISYTFGCSKNVVLKKAPEFRTVYNEVLNKIYNIPFECPDPYNEKAMKRYKIVVRPLNPRMPMLIYYKVDEQGEWDKDSPMYGLVFNKFNKEIIAVCIGSFKKETGLRFKYWIYRDGKYPSPCTASEQEEWLSGYFASRADKI